MDKIEGRRRKNEEFIYTETSSFEIETNQVMRLGISEIQSKIFCLAIQEDSNDLNEETKHTIAIQEDSNDFNEETKDTIDDELDFDF